MLKEVALLSPIFITLFWVLVFMFQGEKKDIAKLSLGIFMFFAFLNYFSHAVYFSNQYRLYSYFESIYIFSVLSLYPLYYNYVLSLTSNRFKLKEQWKGFIPAFVFAFLALFMTLLLTPQEEIFYVQEILIHKNLTGLDMNTLENT